MSAADERVLVSLLASNGPLSEARVDVLARAFGWRRLRLPESWRPSYEPVAALVLRESASWEATTTST